MLTPADDYPIHQLPLPIAHTGPAHNFYDRYWFNGYDGQVFFAAGLAVYPGLDLIDASLAVSCGGVQHNLRASRHLGGDRSRTEVGPLSVEVLEPLRRLRLRAQDNDSGIAADLVFTGRFEPVEENRHGFRAGAREMMDSTRMTQLGHWEGSLRTPQGEHSLSGTPGTRDRSWGQRPVGAQPAQPFHDQGEVQFYWLWAPLHFPSGTLLWYRNDDATGYAWNSGASWSSQGSVGGLDPEPLLRLEQAGHRLEYETDPANRRIRTLRADILAPGGAPLQLHLEQAGRRFYMCGIGYMHPTHGHGVARGPLDVSWDSYQLDELRAQTEAEQAPPFNHIQELVQARLQFPDGSSEEGQGVLEQLLLGPHRPSGFTSLTSSP